MDLPQAEASRQLALLQAEVRRLSTEFERQTAELTALLNKHEHLEEAFVIALAERDKILTSKAWRATRVVQQAMGIPQRVLSPIMTLAERFKPRPSPPAMEPAAPPSEAAKYEQWVEAYDTLSPDDRSLIAARIDRLGHRVAISIVILDAGGADDDALLQKTIVSIKQQIYSDWEICLSRDRAPTGAFIALLAPGDLLPEHALYEVAAEIDAHPKVEMIYTDEDRIDEQGRRYDPAFKPDFSIELQLASHLTGRLTVYRRTLLETIGVLPTAIRHEQEQALALQAAASCGPARIRHIPAVLCHRLVPVRRPDEATTGRHLETDRVLGAVARKLANIEIAPMPNNAGWNKVTWPLPDPLPVVSLIIPTRDRADLLARCVGGLLHRTDYPNLEILIIDNDSIDTGTQSLFQMLQKDPRVRVIPMPGPFNYSALNNAAVRAATGGILVMLNNDVDVIGSGWLKEMVSHAVRPDVGAVGAKLLYGDGRVQHAGVVLGVGQHNAGPGVAGHFGHYATAGDVGYLGQLALTRELSAVTGACLAFRRDVFETVGGFNETELPVAFNDVDFCLRIRGQGFRIIWTPFAELYHLESASRGQAETPEQVARAEQESDYMRHRWGPLLDDDPFYNLNFDRKDHGFELARPPNREKPWRHRGTMRGSTAAVAADKTIDHDR